MTIKPFHALLLLIIISIIPLFTQLDAVPLNQWDESRLGVSAIEMLQNHNWLVPHYCGSPDMWSTKPPFMIWCQAAAISILGVSELAIRLPSVIAGLLTALLLFFFFDRKYKLPLLGLLCATVLLLTQGYIYADHSVRTGDYDAMLTLFTTAYCLSFFLFLDEGKRKYIYFTFTFIALAVLTKSVQALIFMPALLLFTLYKRKLTDTLRDMGFYIGLICCILIVASYYLLREHYNPGYLVAVQANELGGRYGKSLEGHSSSAWDMFRYFLDQFINEWYMLIIPGMVAGFFSTNRRIKDIAVYSTLLALLYLAVIFGAQTRITWYIMPSYPFLAILTGVLLYSVCILLYEAGRRQRVMSRNALPLVFLSLVLVIPYAHMCNRVFSQTYDTFLPAYPRDVTLYLWDALHHPKRRDNSYSILHMPANQQVAWYIKALDDIHNPVNDLHVADLKPGMNVIAGTEVARSYIEEHFNTRFNWQTGTLAFYTLLSPKSYIDTGSINNKK